MHRYILTTLAFIALFLLYRNKESFSFVPGAKWSSGNLLPDNIRVYKDINFTGSFRDFPVGTIQRSLSKGFLGSGLNKENDTYSSIFVPPGIVAELYEHNDFKGRGLRLYAGRHSNLGKWNFNDKVSSLLVKRQ